MTNNNILAFLKKLPLFATADPLLLQKALESEQAHRIDLAAGNPLPSCFAEMLGVLLTGKLQILSADEERTVLLCTATKGHVFGAASLFLENQAPVSRLVAQNECSLLLLERDAVRSLMVADPAFMDAYLRFLAERVRFLNGKIRAFTAGSTERRLALWLTEHAEAGILHAPPLSTLADTLDIGRASLYRALDKLEAEGLIERNGRDITLPYTQALLQKYHS